MPAKKFGKKFACGSSMTSETTIEIQGDIMYELSEFILKEYKQVLFILNRYNYFFI